MPRSISINAGVPAKIMEATKYRNKKFHTKKIGSGFCVLCYLSVGEWECNPTIVENAPVSVLNVVKTCHCPTKMYSFAEVFKKPSTSIKIVINVRFFMIWR
jgi:hypothetical protein